MTARPQVFKRKEQQTLGRGFSSDELKKAGSSLHEAVRLHIAIDPRRKTGHDDNVEKLKILLKERKTAAESKKPKGKSKS
jgi:ribosomal protein L13E